MIMRLPCGEVVKMRQCYGKSFKYVAVTMYELQSVNLPFLISEYLIIKFDYKIDFVLWRGFAEYCLYKEGQGSVLDPCIFAFIGCREVIICDHITCCN